MLIAKRGFGKVNEEKIMKPLNRPMFRYGGPIKEWSHVRY